VSELRFPNWCSRPMSSPSWCPCWAAAAGAELAGQFSVACRTWSKLLPRFCGPLGAASSPWGSRLLGVAGRSSGRTRNGPDGADGVCWPLRWRPRSPAAQFSIVDRRLPPLLPGLNLQRRCMTAARPWAGWLGGNERSPPLVGCFRPHLGPVWRCCKLPWPCSAGLSAAAHLVPTIGPTPPPCCRGGGPA